MTTRLSQSNKVKALFDIWAFCDLINFRGGRASFGMVHKKLAGFITSPQSSKVCKSGKRYNKRRMAQMPRGHLKSTIGSVLYVLWRIYRNPNIRILYGSATKKLVKAFIRELKQYLEDENLGEQVWNNRPHIKGRLIPVLDGQKGLARARGEILETEAADKKIMWNAEAIQVVRDWRGKEPTVQATSAETKATGDHFDLLVLDDVVDFDNSATPTKRETLFDWCQDMESVIDPERRVLCGKAGSIEVWDNVGDEVLLLGTRYFKGDYYEYIEENASDLEYCVFKRNIYRNGVDNTGGYIWQSRFNDATVARLRKRLTARRWASQYLNTIYNETDNPLNRDKVRWLASRFIHVNSDGMVQVTIADQPKPIELRPYLIIDPAISLAKTADSTSILVGAVDREGRVFVLDVKYGKFTPQRSAEAVEELCKRWNIYTVYLENNNVGAALTYTLRNHFKTIRPLAIREHRVGVGNIYGIKGDKATRIENRLQPLLENEQLYMSDFIAANTNIMDEFDMFPSVSGHDDFLDTIDQLCAIAKPRLSKTQKKTRQRPVNKKYGGTR